MKVEVIIYKKNKLFWKSIEEAKKANNSSAKFWRNWWSSLLWNRYFILEKTKWKTLAGSGDGLCQACTYLEEMYVKLKAARLGETSCWLCHSAKSQLLFKSHIIKPLLLKVCDYRRISSLIKRKKKNPENAKLSCMDVEKSLNTSFKWTYKGLETKRNTERTMFIVSNNLWFSEGQFFLLCNSLFCETEPILLDFSQLTPTCLLHLAWLLSTGLSLKTHGKARVGLLLVPFLYKTEGLSNS